MSAPKASKKKNDSKSTGQLLIPVEDFIRTRDSVVTSLHTLQTAVSQVLTRYIQHANTVLGNDSSDILEGLGTELPAGVLTAAELVKGGKRKRTKRAEKDPNAPKRPLTAYFLFSQQARPEAKEKLGETAGGKDISDEILRQWTEMDDSSKKYWKDLYEENRKVYEQDVKLYKERTGQIAAVDDDASGEAAAAAAQLKADAAHSDESEREPTPKAPTPQPAKETKKRATKKAAATPKATPKAAEAKAEKRKAKDTEVAAPEEPKKKRARKSEAETPKATPADDKKKGKKEATKKEPAKKDATKKKRKSDA